MAHVAAADDGVRVVSAKARVLSLPLDPPIVTPNYRIDTIETVFLRLEDSDGVVGHSYLWCFGTAQADLLVAALRYLAPLVVGEPVDPAARAQALRKEMNFLGFKGVTVFGCSAYDLALHDVLGKRSGVSLATSRGRLRDRVPVYWSGFFLSSGIDELVAEVDRAAAAGFRAVKVRVGHPSLHEDVRRVEAVVAAVPAGTTVMLDAVQAWTPRQAVEAARALADVGARWLEDPVLHHDYAGLADVVASSPIAVASGENEYLREGFRQLTESGLPYLLADLQRVGGITEWDAVVDVAKATGAVLTPHVYPHTSAQLAATLDQDEVWVEHVPWWDGLMTYPLEVSDGLLTVPEVPGTGIDPEPEQIDRHAVGPWIRLC